MPAHAPITASDTGPLTLRPADLQRIRQWAVAAHPAESCGLLVGRRGGAGEGVGVEWVTLAHNRVAGSSTDSYELDPADWIATHDRATQAGLEIVGVWHSHPDCDARPSHLDLENAWAGYSYLIAALGTDRVHDWRAWQLHRGAFREQPLTT